MNDSGVRLRARLRLASRLWPALAVFALTLQVVVPYRGWTMLLVALGGAWLAAYVWARVLRRGLRVRREMRFGWAQVGDRLEERFTLENGGWLPALWVEVADDSTLPGYAISHATGVSALSRSQWRTQGICTRRGIFRLGPTRLRTGDPFGLCSVEINDDASATLVVMPQVVALPSIDVAPGGRAGEGRRTRDSIEPTVSAARVRDYRPGDAARWIHWRTSARRDALFVRQFDSMPAGDWWLALDLARATQSGEGQDSTIEHAIVLAASLAERGLRDGRAVGLVAEGSDSVWLPPQLGDAQRWRLLRALTLAETGQITLRDLLQHSSPFLRHAASLVLITADVSAAWLEPLLPLQRRGLVPTVLLLDPVSFGGTGEVRPVQAALAEYGIAAYVVERTLLDRAGGRAHRQGVWDWRVTGTGRAVAVEQPRDLEWKALPR